MKDLKVGDEIVQKYGPYRVTATVIEVNERGAVLSLPFNAVLEGFDEIVTAPDGTALTADLAHDFLGRAHFGAVKFAEDK